MYTTFGPKDDSVLLQGQKFLAYGFPAYLEMVRQLHDGAVVLTGYLLEYGQLSLIKCFHAWIVSWQSLVHNGNFS